MDADPGSGSHATMDVEARHAGHQPDDDGGPTFRCSSLDRRARGAPGPPVHDLDRSAAFYRYLLGLQPSGGFTDHEGNSGVFFALPGGAELGLTRGPGVVLPSSTDDLLALFVASAEDARRQAEALMSAGVPTVPSANPYWDRRGRTVLDPDGYAVVVAAADGTSAAQDVALAQVRVEPFTGERERLRELFELAEDSTDELNTYLHTGGVLAAVTGAQVVGHLQLVDTGRPGQVELENMAVRETLQGHGLGRQLVAAAGAAVPAAA